MSRCTHRRPVWFIACGWLLAWSLAAVIAAAPALDVDSIGGRVITLQGATGDYQLLLPPLAARTPSAAADDLSGPAASATFRLTSPQARHAPRPRPTSVALDARAGLVLAERGPPASA